MIGALHRTLTQLVDKPDQLRFVAISAEAKLVALFSNCALTQHPKLSNLDQVRIFQIIQGDFFNWPSPEFAKCWPVSN